MWSNIIEGDEKQNFFFFTLLKAKNSFVERHFIIFGASLLLSNLVFLGIRLTQLLLGTQNYSEIVKWSGLILIV